MNGDGDGWLPEREETMMQRYYAPMHVGQAFNFDVLRALYQRGQKFDPYAPPMAVPAGGYPGAAAGPVPGIQVPYTAQVIAPQGNSLAGADTTTGQAFVYSESTANYLASLWAEQFRLTAPVLSQIFIWQWSGNYQNPHAPVSVVRRSILYNYGDPRGGTRSWVAVSPFQNLGVPCPYCPGQ